jgi:hypothetical protein
LQARPLTMSTFWAKRRAASSAVFRLLSSTIQASVPVWAPKASKPRWPPCSPSPLTSMASTGATRAMSSAPQTFSDASSFCAVWLSA